MNLECVMSNVGHKWDETPKVFHFRSGLKNIQCLKNAKIDTLSCANNHILDYRHEAMVEMLQTFDQMQYPYVGIDMNFEQAAAMKIANVNNLKIDIISCTDNEPGWEATDDKMGARYIKIDPADHRYQMLLQQIKQQRQLVDLMIVSIHWCGNWDLLPPDQHRQRGRQLIDAGADIIFGHCAHIIRGVEVYKSKPIIYSGGDFVDDYAIDPEQRNDLGGIFEVNIDDCGQAQSLIFHPTVIKDFQVNHATGNNLSLISNRFINMCQEMNTIATVMDHKVHINLNY